MGVSDDAHHVLNAFGRLIRRLRVVLTYFMSQGFCFYENHYFISHVELGVALGVFEGADHAKDIDSLFHH